MHSRVQLPAIAVQPVHVGIVTVCLVNEPDTAPLRAFVQPALIPLRIPPGLPELEPLMEPEVAPLAEPLMAPEVAPVAAPEVAPVVAPEVAPEAVPLVVPVPPTPLVFMPEPTTVPLMTLPLEPATPPAPLVPTPEAPTPLVVPLPEPLVLAPLLEPELATGSPTVLGLLHATAVKSATHGSVRSQTFEFIGEISFGHGLCSAGGLGSRKSFRDCPARTALSKMLRKAVRARTFGIGRSSRTYCVEVVDGPDVARSPWTRPRSSRSVPD
jgi:hypothetical protein